MLNSRKNVNNELKVKKNLVVMDYQIVHAIEGRIRIRIPLLGEDTGYQSKLQSLVESLKFVTDVRINPMAESMIVTYKFKAISCENMQAHLQQAIEQSFPPEPSSAPAPTPEPAVVKEKSPEVAKEIVQEEAQNFWEG
jgi:Heavy metal associated domain 2